MSEAKQKAEPIVESVVSQMDPEKLFSHGSDGEFRLNTSQLSLTGSRTEVIKLTYYEGGCFTACTAYGIRFIF